MRRKDARNKILQLQIRIAPDEKAAIVRQAKAANMGISEWVLSKALPSGRQAFQGALAELKKGANQKFALAELHDLLNEAASAEFEAIVEEPPQVSLPPYLANYVAAMVEYAAVKKGSPAPKWTVEVPALDEPVFGSELLSLKLHLLTHSPPPFRRRNLFIDSTIGERI